MSTDADQVAVEETAGEDPAVDGEQHHGALTRDYSLTRGLGTSLGRGWAAWWSGPPRVCAAAVLLSLIPLRRLRAEARSSSGAFGRERHIRLEAHARPTLEVIVREAPEHLQKRVDPESGLPLIRP